MKEILKETHKELAKRNSECINLGPQMTVLKKGEWERKRI